MEKPECCQDHPSRPTTSREAANYGWLYPRLSIKLARAVPAGSARHHAHSRVVVVIEGLTLHAADESTPVAGRRPLSRRHPLSTVDSECRLPIE